MILSMDEKFFSSKEASKVTGCTIRQLQYWREKEIIVPPISGTGTGRSIYYSYPELVELTIMGYWLKIGLSFDIASVMMKKLQSEEWDYLNRETQERLMLHWDRDVSNLKIEQFDRDRAIALLSEGLPIIPLWLDQIHQQLTRNLIQKGHEIELLEQAICQKLQEAGWKFRFYAEMDLPSFFRGRMEATSRLRKQQTKKRYFSEFILSGERTHPVAVVQMEARETLTDQGLKKAIEEAKSSRIRLAYLTNGEEIIEYDLMTGESETIDHFLTPKELSNRLNEKESSSSVSEN